MRRQHFQYSVSIHSLRKKGDETNCIQEINAISVSIHSLRKKGDTDGHAYSYQWRVSIHSLRKKGDAEQDVIFDGTRMFQSTPFARRETLVGQDLQTGRIVSIHSLRKKGDWQGRSKAGQSAAFQSTPFARRETTVAAFDANSYIVSIHSLRKKGDVFPAFPLIAFFMFQSTPFARRETPGRREDHGKQQSFNPLPSQEGRPDKSMLFSAREMFQSTPFARRETMFYIHPAHVRKVSIHSLRKKGDDFTKIIFFKIKRFNPLPSQEGRPDTITHEASNKAFQSTPFARRETISKLDNRLETAVSIHSLRKKGDTSQSTDTVHDFCFNPLPSQEGRHHVPIHADIQNVFQSTPFARRETRFKVIHGDKVLFQSTPFARRETTTSNRWHRSSRSFNPLPSQEGRLAVP